VPPVDAGGISSCVPPKVWRLDDGKHWRFGMCNGTWAVKNPVTLVSEGFLPIEIPV